jgi:hypothetical protein
MLGIIVAAVMFIVYALFLKKDKVESLYRAAGLMFFWYIIKGVIDLVSVFAGGLPGGALSLVLLLVIAMPIAGAWLIKESCRGAVTVNDLNQAKLAGGVCLTALYLGLVFF